MFDSFHNSGVVPAPTRIVCHDCSFERVVAPTDEGPRAAVPVDHRRATGHALTRVDCPDAGGDR